MTNVTFKETTPFVWQCGDYLNPNVVPIYFHDGSLSLLFTITSVASLIVVLLIACCPSCILQNLQFYNILRRAIFFLVADE